jgi:hypothetical protein
MKNTAPIQPFNSYTYYSTPVTWSSLLERVGLLLANIEPSNAADQNTKEVFAIIKVLH